MEIRILKSAVVAFLLGQGLSAQLGVNNETPEAMLDVVGTTDTPPMKVTPMVQRTQTQPVMMLIDAEDKVVSSKTVYYPIVYQSISSQTGIDLAYTSNSTLYDLNASPTDFKMVDDLTVSILIDNQIGVNNVLNIELFGVAQFNSNSILPNTQYFDFEVGIFIDNQLKVLRRFSATGDGFQGPFLNIDLKGVVRDLPNGTYEVKVGFLSKSSNGTVPLAIGKPANSFVGNFMTQELAKLNLKIYGVYY